MARGKHLDRHSLGFPGNAQLEQTVVICPEGLWVRHAGIQLLQKEKPEEWGKLNQFDAARSLIRLLLVTQELKAFSISSSSGTKEPVDRDYLRSSDAVQDFMQGYKPFSADRRRTPGRYFFVDRVQFENFLADKPIFDQSDIPASVVSELHYIRPYVRFMLDAVAALELTSEKRLHKDGIVRWLEDNWPDDLDGKSDRMIQSMATMLRSPEHKKGGNTSWKK